MSVREAAATAPRLNPDSESKMPSTGARTTGLVSACRSARRTRAAEVSASVCSLLLDSSSSSRVSGLTRIEPVARATATGTVLVGPRIADMIGRPTPARVGKATVRACREASALDVLETGRWKRYQIRYSNSMTTPRIAKSGPCLIISLRGAEAVATNRDAGSAKFMTRALSSTT